MIIISPAAIVSQQLMTLSTLLKLYTTQSSGAAPLQIHTEAEAKRLLGPADVQPFDFAQDGLAAGLAACPATLPPVEEAGLGLVVSHRISPAKPVRRAIVSTNSLMPILRHSPLRGLRQDRSRCCCPGLSCNHRGSLPPGTPVVIIAGCGLRWPRCSCWGLRSFLHCRRTTREYRRVPECAR